LFVFLGFFFFGLLTRTGQDGGEPCPGVAVSEKESLDAVKGVVEMIPDRWKPQ
jgi:hypothetical protein